MKAVFSNRAYAGVMAETAEKIKTETGGLFLGAVEHDTWYIIEAIDPGPKSVFEVAYFEYDQKYTQHLINKVANLYHEKLTLIGLWHRHPGSFDSFSSTDNSTNSKYARMRPNGAISALVNIDPKFRITMYHVGQPCRYAKVSYQVGDNLIPAKYMQLKTPEHFERIMENISQPRRPAEYQPSISLNSFMDTLKPLFEDRQLEQKIGLPTQEDEAVREKIVNTVLSDIVFMSEQLHIKMSVVQKGAVAALIQDTVNGVLKVCFAYSEANDMAFFQYGGNNFAYEDGLFEKLYQQGNRQLAGEQQSAPTSPWGQGGHTGRTLLGSMLRPFRPEKGGEE